MQGRTPPPLPPIRRPCQPKPPPPPFLLPSGADPPSAAAPADSGTSSDKRRRQAGQQQQAAPAQDDASSSLLPLQPLSAEAASRLQRLGSPEEEQEKEAEALVSMLGAAPGGQQASHPADGGFGDDELGRSGALQLAGQLEALHLEPPLEPDTNPATRPGPSGMAIDADATAQGVGLQQPQAAGPPGSPQAAAAAAEAVAAAAEASSPRRQSPGAELGPRADPVIRRLVEAEAAEPIQMLPLDALTKNPLLQQFQQQRQAAARAAETARAVAAAEALRQQGMGLNEEEDDEVVAGTLV